MLSAAFLALSLVPQGTPTTSGAPGGSAGAGGQGTASPIPAYRDDVPSNDFLTWRGWSYLQGAAPSIPRPYPGPPDWTNLASAPKPAEDAVALRVKFVIFRSVERLGKDANGILRADRETIEDNQFGEVQAAIQRLALQVAAASGGKARLVPDISIETETMRGPLTEDAFGEPFIQGYLRPRLNGGGYEAEDKVYRGAYHAVICLLPATIQPKENHFQVHGMDTQVLSIERPSGPFYPGVLDEPLRAALGSALYLRVLDRGYMSTDDSANDWNEIANLNEVTGAELVARAGKPAPTALIPLSHIDRHTRTWRTPTAEPSIVTDTEKGQVLKLFLRGPTRAMAIMFPDRNDGEPIAKLAEGRTLNLSIRTLAKDPLAIRLQGKDKVAWVALQPEVVLPFAPQDVRVPMIHTAPIKADGTWEKVAIDIGALAKEAGMDEVMAIGMEFSPRARQTMRTLTEAMEVFIDDIHFSNDPATAPVAPTDDSMAKAQMAAQATATSPELVALLSERNPLVRLNAADAFTRIKDPASVDALATLAMSMDSSVAERAIHALAFQETETATASIRRTVRMALSGHSRAVAALVLADGKDPKIAGDLATMLAHRDWQTRLAGVRALGKLPNREAAIIRLAFLAQENPEIKLAVTEGIDPNDEPQVRRLLWSVVNEPQDLVRAESALKLIQSPLPALKAEGYKAVRDDSPTVRRIVLTALGARPDEGHREALRIAIADKNASVRVLAIRAFAALEKGATDEELAPVMEDVHPDVQIALIDYAKKRGTKLPPAVVDRMRSSLFPRVRDAAKGIGE
ncbi:MAG: HEAT repeat domain-containing protein [Fimbriimonas sp.]